MSSFTEHCFYCHDCRAWSVVAHDPDRATDEPFDCPTCGSVILCDGCGQPWTEDHECKREETT